MIERDELLTALNGLVLPTGVSLTAEAANLDAIRMNVSITQQLPMKVILDRHPYESGQSISSFAVVSILNTNDVIRTLNSMLPENIDILVKSNNQMTLSIL